MRFLLLPLLALGAHVGAAAMTLEERLALIADPDGGTIEYVEVRESALLEAPLTVHGRLGYDPASGALTKWVDSPRSARLTLGDTHLELEDSRGRTRRVNLQHRPEIATLLGGLRALVSGRADGLGDHFESDYREGDDDTWSLTLAPTDPAVRKRLLQLDVQGAGAFVEVIETRFADGRRERMTLLRRDTASPTEPPDAR